jgi:hypothetical protein
MRTLIVIPIVHTKQDMGSLLEQTRFEAQRFEQSRQLLPSLRENPGQTAS